MLKVNRSLKTMSRTNKGFANSGSNLGKGWIAMLSLLHLLERNGLQKKNRIIGCAHREEITQLLYNFRIKFWRKLDPMCE
jgi:hypothetical protein